MASKIETPVLKFFIVVAFATLFGIVALDKVLDFIERNNANVQYKQKETTEHEFKIEANRGRSP
jgi:hypothetical protein